MTDTMIDSDTIILETRIPEHYRIPGLVYGAHVSRIGRCGYYVRLAGDDRWLYAELTPASDELPEAEDDETEEESILRAIRDEIE